MVKKGTERNSGDLTPCQNNSLAKIIYKARAEIIINVEIRSRRGV